MKTSKVFTTAGFAPIATSLPIPNNYLPVVQCAKSRNLTVNPPSWVSGQGLNVCSGAGPASPLSKSISDRTVELLFKLALSIVQFWPGRALGNSNLNGGKLETQICSGHRLCSTRIRPLARPLNLHGQPFKQADSAAWNQLKLANSFTLRRPHQKHEGQHRKRGGSEEQEGVVIADHQRLAADFA